MWPPRRLVILAAFLILAAVVLLKGVGPALLSTQGDFANYYSASKILSEGGSIEDAYIDFLWFQKEMDRHGIRRQVGGFIPHPPPAALVFLPLTPFDALTAKRIWTLANVILLAFCVVLLASLSGVDWMLAGIILLGCGAGLINQFLFGQLYLLLLTSILLAMYFHRKGHSLAAGVCLGSLIPVKYVGVLWFVYYCRQRQWKLVAGACLSIVLVLGLTLWLDGPRSLGVFVQQVLPRHLAGEIQDPFSIRLQSWNSLFRRLFLYEETLNPSPVINEPMLFFFSKNLVFWCLAAAAVLVLERVSLDPPAQRNLFRMGWLPLVVLLLAPGGATYHFLLLAISAIFFFKILRESGRPVEGVLVTLLFIGINLPHYLWLEPLCTGWLTPFAYSRLGLLLFFFLWIVWTFRHRINWTGLTGPGWAVLASVIIFASLAEHRQYKARLPLDDGAHWLSVQGREFDRQLGLLLAEPDLGRDHLVFSYCELLDNGYAIFAQDGSRWTAHAESNYYGSDLFHDDASLLVETVREGKNEIWQGKARNGHLAFAVVGEDPSWAPDGGSFAFNRDGQLFIYELARPAKQLLPLSTSSNCYDVAYSPKGTHLAYCSKTGRGSALCLFDLKRQEEQIILTSETRIAEPAWSFDQQVLVFSWETAGNRDIWALPLKTNASPLRLTRHPARDNDPLWDQSRRRIVFTSDRGRGLEFNALFWIPIPRQLK